MSLPGDAALPPAEVLDLRSALRLLANTPGELLRTETAVDPNAGLAGVYRYVGAGGTVLRPTKTGPAMLFETVRGCPGVRVFAGLLATRKRTALLVGSTRGRLGRDLLSALNSPVAPTLLANGDPAPSTRPRTRTAVPTSRRGALPRRPSSTARRRSPSRTASRVRASSKLTRRRFLPHHPGRSGIDRQ